MSGTRHGPRFVRPYTLTGGRTGADAADLALETLVTRARRAGLDRAALAWEKADIVRRCERPQSIAELAAHLGVPLGVARVLVADLRDAGWVDVSATSTDERPDLDLMERVLDGLRAL